MSNQTTNELSTSELSNARNNATPTITIIARGPYKVSGSIKLYEDAIISPSDEDTYPLQYNRIREIATQEGSDYFLCRCGQSKNKPFCDGSHIKSGFIGEETADRRPYQTRTIKDKHRAGEILNLEDDGRCAFARFCHRKEGKAWGLTLKAHDEASAEEAIRASWHCPTGRLQHTNRSSDTVYEDTFEPSILVLQDVPIDVSCALFARGKIQLIGSDGFTYEIRNRYSLCRCGRSANKPFCDGTHHHIGFKDESTVWEGELGERDTSFSEDPVCSPHL